MPIYRPSGAQTVNPIQQSFLEQRPIRPRHPDHQR